MNIAIFATGRGSNAQSIIDYFRLNESIHINLIVSNKATAGVLDIAVAEGISTAVINKEELENPDFMASLLQSIDYIILAGFLQKIPKHLTTAFKDKILNIHPALLPKYGGKGMYGMNVHQAVKDHEDRESGITIHLVDEVYDNGAHLFQASVAIDATDSVAQIAEKVLKLEHHHYPRIIEEYISK